MFIQVNLKIPGASFTMILRNRSSLVCFCCCCFLCVFRDCSLPVMTRLVTLDTWTSLPLTRQRTRLFAVRSLHATCAHASAWWSTCRASAMRRDTRAPLMNELRTCHHSRTAPLVLFSLCFVEKIWVNYAPSTYWTSELSFQLSLYSRKIWVLLRAYSKPQCAAEQKLAGGVRMGTGGGDYWPVAVGWASRLTTTSRTV